MISALVACLFLVSACSAGTSSGTPADNQNSSKPGHGKHLVPQPSALSAFYEQHLNWHACDGKFQCSTLIVPESYQDPSGTELDLAVVRYVSTDHPTGSLIINPGGPGASGIEFLEDAYTTFRAEEKKLTLVSFDPRGVGKSDPIRCVSSSFLDSYENEPPAPVGTAQIHHFVKLAKEFANDCSRRNGSYLERVGTLNVARDMDVLRAVLGDKKISYYGASYGTFIGAKYAQLFPRHIRAMVLDGAVNPAQSAMSADRAQAIGFETDLDDFISYCVDRGNCPLGPTVDSAMAGLHALAAKIAAHPEVDGSRTLGPGEFFNGLADGFYDSSDWPELETSLQDAQQGNPAAMLYLADQITERNSNGTYDNLIEANTAINCVDRSSPRSLSTYERDAKSDAKAAPFFGAAIAWSSLVCAYWKVPPSDSAHPVHADDASQTILVIGSTHDPATPYQQAVALARQLGNARLLTRDGDGHTALFVGSACIDDAVAAYFDKLQLPPENDVCQS